jgi:hypothetical protein
MTDKKGSPKNYLKETFVPLPPDHMLKNYHPSKPAKPPGDPAKPFPVDGPIGTKPDAGGATPPSDPGTGTKKPA